MPIYPMQKQNQAFERIPSFRSIAADYANIDEIILI